MFWKKQEGKGELSGPKGVPDLVGQFMVVKEKQNPDWVWKLKSVLRPAGKKKDFYCRIFDELQASKSGVKVKDWTSLDEHPDLILWEGYFDKENHIARREKFVKPS